MSLPLQWRHNGHDGVSNHQRLDCLLNRLFRRRSNKTSKLRVITFVREIIGDRSVNSPHKGPVTRKMFPFDDVIVLIPGLGHGCLPIWHQLWIESIINYTLDEDIQILSMRIKCLHRFTLCEHFHDVNNVVHFSPITFSNAFCRTKPFYFDSISFKFVSKGPLDNWCR